MLLQLITQYSGQNLIKHLYYNEFFNSSFPSNSTDKLHLSKIPHPNKRFGSTTSLHTVNWYNADTNRTRRALSVHRRRIRSRTKAASMTQTLSFEYKPTHHHIVEPRSCPTMSVNQTKYMRDRKVFFEGPSNITLLVTMAQEAYMYRSAFIA